jgi:hypothetical protein
VKAPPSWNGSVEELFDLAVQTSEIVVVPNPGVVAGKASVVFVLGVQSQFELFANVHFVVAKD